MTISEAILARPDLLVDDAADRYEKVGQVPGLCVGYVPGVMPGKWFNRWKERYSALAPLTDVALAEACGLEALDVFADMVLVRAEEEPAARDKKRYHAIELYRETPVVILPKDHLLTVLESVPVADLTEEFLLQDPAEVPTWAQASASYRQENPRPLPAMRHRADAIELVAAGLGLVVAPMSVARFYHRKDLTYRPLEGVEDYAVLLVWKRDPGREDAREQIIQDFVGITRGRTAASNRGSDSREVALDKQRRAKEEAKRKRAAANKKREAEDRKRRNARKNGTLRQYQAQKGQGRGKKK